MGAVGLVVLREPRKTDLGRLSFDGFSEEGSNRVAWFRYEVPRWQVALTNGNDSVAVMDRTLVYMTIWCGADQRQKLPSAFGALGLERVRQHNLENGWITKFAIEPPNDEIWCLEMPVCVRNEGLHRLAAYVSALWQSKGIQTLKSMERIRIIGTVRSALITNVVPQTADAPAK